MGKMIFKVFVKGFLQAIFVIVCMILCGVGGFFGTRFYYSKKADKENSAKAADMIGDAQIDEVSKNLIYVWNEDKGRISSCVLEVFDTNNKKLDYITIPTSGQITISADMYKKLYQVNQEIPQVFTLSKLCSYFDKGDDTSFGYGVLILEDYFDIDVSYYTVISEDVFEEMFESREVEIDENGEMEGVSYKYSSSTEEDNDEDEGIDPYAHDDRFATTNNYADATTAAAGTTEAGATTEEPISSTTTVKVRVLKDSYLSDMSQYSEEKDLKDYVEGLCDKIKSNLDSSDKLSYVEPYLELSEGDIRYYCTPGSYDNKTYVFQLKNTSALFRKCNVDRNQSAEEDAEEDSDDDTPEGLQSELFNLVILNSTGTSGVAAKWSEEMTQLGYNVKEVGNYQERLTDTLIIVSEEGQGEEFLKYFQNASIKVGTVPNGADAQIIIGTNDIK